MSLYFINDTFLLQILSSMVCINQSIDARGQPLALLPIV